MAISTEDASSNSKKKTAVVSLCSEDEAEEHTAVPTEDPHSDEQESKSTLDIVSTKKERYTSTPNSFLSRLQSYATQFPTISKHE